MIREKTGKKEYGRSSFSRNREIKDEFESKLLDLARVTRVTAGGKRLRFRAVVVVGNKQGKTGIGVSKGSDVAQAVEKATRLAKKNLITVPLTEGETIPHEVYAKFGAAKVIIKPQKKGRGLVAGGAVRIICSLTGIKNISSKILGRTTNKLNNAQAVMAAFKKLKVKKEKVEKTA
ncbi:MAG TPA: 30S ribosomal protein S5 [Patescibacteria group bacterium]|nr:30S ribosomal protein S5 [Patescibacteria group bacterium]